MKAGIILSERSVWHSSLFCYFLDVFICIHILFIGLNLLIAVVLFYSDQSLVAMALPKFLFRTTHIHKFTPLFTLIQPPAADSLKS